LELFDSGIHSSSSIPKTQIMFPLFFYFCSTTESWQSTKVNSFKE